MARKRYSAEQIIGYLREAEVLLVNGSTIGQVCRKLGITGQTYYRWRRDYGSRSVDQGVMLISYTRNEHNSNLGQFYHTRALIKKVLKK